MVKYAHARFHIHHILRFFVCVAFGVFGRCFVAQSGACLVVFGIGVFVIGGSVDVVGSGVFVIIDSFGVCGRGDGVVFVCNYDVGH